MFFDPSDYLHGDPQGAESVREAKQLRRDARQRAGLCHAMVAVTAKRGYEHASIHETVGLAGYGKATYYKLFPTREACLLEAFERCSDAIVAAVEEAVIGAADPVAKAEAGLGTLVEVLAAHRDVARVALVEIRVAGPPCREAQQRWLGRLAELLRTTPDPRQLPQVGETEWLTAAGLSTVLAAEVIAGRTKELPGIVDELVEAVAIAFPGRRRSRTPVASTRRHTPLPAPSAEQIEARQRDMRLAARRSQTRRGSKAGNAAKEKAASATTCVEVEAALLKRAERLARERGVTVSRLMQGTLERELEAEAAPVRKQSRGKSNGST